MRWRALAVALALLAYLMVGVGDTAPGRGTAATADGRLRFRIPATWRADPCARLPDCLTVGPVGTLEDDRVTVMIFPTDPDGPEGDPSLFLFDPSLGAGVQRYDLDGRPAVRTDEPGAHLLMVLLDSRGDRALDSRGDRALDSRGDRAVAVVLCPLNGSLHDGCDMVIGSLHVRWP